MIGKQKFNWKGIVDNGDGSFVTKGKIEKKRLLRSLHETGYKVRSRKNSDGSWSILTVGYMRPSRKRAISRGYRPAVRRARFFDDDDDYFDEPRTKRRAIQGRYIRLPGRYVPLRGGMPRRFGNPMGGPGIPVRSGPRGQGKSMGQRLMDWQRGRMKRLQAEQDARNKAKKEGEETNEKMRHDREQHEQAQNLKTIRHSEFQAQRDQERQNREQADRMRQQESDNMKAIRHAEFQAQRDQERQNREAKVDQSKLQEARENEITG